MRSAARILVLLCRQVHSIQSPAAILTCDFTKRLSDGTARALLPRHGSLPELSAFIGVYRRLNKDVLASRKLPREIY
jgi:hypothetical protein